MKHKNCYEIKAKSDSETELLIYGDIGDSWLDESTTAKTVVEALNSISTSLLTVRINSYGGAVADGLAIYNAIRRFSGEVTTKIDGVAVSIASLIAMAGDVIEIAENAMIMIHAPWGASTGNAKEMREFADILDKYAEAMVSSYERKTSKSHGEILNLLTDGEDHWYSAEEAINEGFADLVIEELAIAAHGFTKSKYIKSGLQCSNSSLHKLIEDNGDIKMPQPKKKDEVEANVLAKDKERRSSIKNAFQNHLIHNGVQALLDDCLDDPYITEVKAREALLNKLGEGSESLSTQPSMMSNAHDDHKTFKDAAVDALLIRSGNHLSNPHPAARDLRNMSVVSMAETMLKHRGQNTQGMNTNEIVSYSMTSGDFPLLLQNVAGKSLMMGYENEPASHRMWVKPTEVRDFKPVNRVAVSEAPGLLEIAQGGEYKHGSLGERAESYQLATFGRILTLSRQAMINDDLGGFTRVPQAFGASAARLEADKVYSILISNPVMSDSVTLFHASHKNLMTAGALSVTELGIARAAMRKQKGIKGEGVLNIVPRFLIVPASLETTAEQLIASLVDPSKSNDTGNLSWIRRLELVVDARLDEDSTTSWYLAASNSQIDTVEIAHLEGQRGVFTEDQTEFSTDAYSVKARLDFAAAAIDWVGLIKNPGL